MQNARIPPLPVVIGESGAKDWGDNSLNNTDTTNYTNSDKIWLEIVATYLRALSDKTGRQVGRSATDGAWRYMHENSSQATTHAA